MSTIERAFGAFCLLAMAGLPVGLFVLTYTISPALALLVFPSAVTWGLR